MSQTMRAIVLSEFGAPENLQLREIPLPEIKSGHVLVQVRAISVNPVDTKIRKGLLAAIAPEAPTVLGCDVAGIVHAAAPDIPFKIGDEVFGCVGGVQGCPGTAAEYVLADARLLAKKPSNLDFLSAAALPLVSITAYEALIDRANIRPGQDVLVHGGTGGVGHIALQIAKAKGARVFTTVSTNEKAALAKSLGADHTIPYRDLTVADYVTQHTAGRGFDVVLDTVGGENVARCFEAAAVSGTVASISTRTTCDLIPLHAKGLSLHVVFMLIPMLYNRGDERARHGQILREISTLCEAGKLRPLLDPSTFSLTQLPAAHAHLESGRALGKIVLAGF